MAITTTEIALIIKARDEASSTLRGMEKSIGGVQSGMANVVSTAVGFGVAQAGMMAFGKATEFVSKTVVGFNSDLEQSAVSWTTMLQSADAAQAIMLQIQQFAAKTPFEFPDVERAAKRFVGMGFSAQEAINLLTPVGNAAAAIGTGAVGIDRISLALGQMSAKGKVTGEEMRQLTEAQVPAWGLLSEATGKSTAELMKMSEQGKISSATFIDAFSKMYGEGGKFGDLMQEQSKTFGGSMSTISDQINIVGSTAFKPIFTAISNLAKAISAFVQSDEFTIWGARIQTVVQMIVDGLGVLTSVFMSTLGGVLSIVSTVGQAIYTAMQWLNPFASHSPSLVSQVEDGVGQIEDAYGRLGSAAGAFDVVGAAFKNLTAVTQQFTSAFGDDLPSKTEKAIAIMGPGARAAFDTATAAMDEARAAVQELGAEFEAAQDALVPYKDAVDDAKSALDDKKDALDELKSKLADAKDALEPMEDELKSFEEAAKAAEAAIKDLGDAQLAGTADMQANLSKGNIALKEQELSLSRLKQSDAYKSIGAQIKTAEASIKAMQGTEQLSAAGREQQKKAIDDQRALIDRLKASQESMLAPAQAELETRKDTLDALRLERDSTLGLAEDRIKAASAAALGGGKEMTEAQVMDAIAAAKAARDKALSQAGGLAPQVAGQQQAIKSLEAQIKSQSKAVDDAEEVVDAATAAYDRQKKSVDELGAQYKEGKSALADYDRQMKDMIQTAEMQITKQKEAATAAKAAEKAAGVAAGPVGPKGDVTAGIDFEAAKKKMDDFKTEVENTKKNISNVFAPVTRVFDTVSTAITRLSRAFQPVDEVVEDVSDEMGQMVSATRGVSSALMPFVAAIANLKDALLPLGVAFQSAFSQFQSGDVLGGLQTLLAGFHQFSASLIGIIGGLGSALGEWLGPQIPIILGQILNMGTQIIGALTIWYDAIVKQMLMWAGAFLDWILPLAPQLIASLGGLLTTILNWILSQHGTLLNMVMRWGTAFVDWIIPFIPKILDSLQGIVQNIWKWIRDVVPTLLNHLGQWATAFIDWIVPLLPKLLSQLQLIAARVIVWIFQAVPELLGALVEWAGVFIGWVAPMIPKVLAALGGLIGQLASWIVDVALPLIVDGLVTWGAAFLEWIGPRIPPLLTELARLAGEIIKWIGDQIPGITNKLGEWGTRFVDWIKDDVLPKIGPALNFIINGGEGWEGLVTWIPAQVKAIAEKLTEWGAAFIDWVAKDAVPFISEKLNALWREMSQWIKDQGPLIIQETAFWATNFFIWIVKAVVETPRKLNEIGAAIAAWVKGEGSTKMESEGGKLGEAFMKGMADFFRLFTYSTLGDIIIKGVQGMVPSIRDGVAKALSEAMSGGVSAGLAATSGGGQRGAGGGVTTIPQRVGEYLTAQGLSADAISAFCGPLAAEAIKRGLTGLNTNMMKLLEDAVGSGWSSGAGMGGTGAFQKLLGKMGIGSVLTKNMDEVIAAFAKGLPVAISTGAHYYLATGLDELNRFIVDESAKVVGQGTKLTLAEMDKRSKEITAKWGQAVVGFKDFVIPSLKPTGGGAGLLELETKQMGEFTANLHNNIPALKAYIEQAAIMRGIDPGTAIKVAAAETANFTKFIGDLGSSFGPFQLHLGNITGSGPHSMKGLGDEFQRLKGLDPRDVTTWAEQVDFALDDVAKNGWGAFHAAADRGISRMEGVNVTVPKTRAEIEALSASLKSPAPTLMEMSAQLGITDDAVEAFALQFGVSWDVARQTMVDAGGTASAVLAGEIPAAIEATNVALGDVGGTFERAKIAFADLKEYGPEAMYVAQVAAEDMAKSFGLNMGQAEAIIRDQGAVAKEVLGEGIPGEIEITNEAVEKFADAFGIGWNEARDILESAGKTGQAVMGTLLPNAVAIAGGALDDLKTDTKTAATQGIDVLSDSTADLADDTESLKRPADEARGAIGDLGTKMGEVAANQAERIAAVLLRLRDGLLGEGDYGGRGLIAAVRQLIDELNKIPRRIDIQITQDVRNTGAALARRQHGGPVSSGLGYLVGEAGPELFVPSSTGRVFSHGALVGAGGGGGGGMTVNITVQGSVISERDLVETVRTALVRTGRRNLDIFGGLA